VTASTIDTDALIVGAGPAGLAMGACLRRLGICFEILERGAAVGTAWRGHYDRLHLHTARDHSALPYHPFPADYPLYVPRLKVVEYLEDYARRFDLAPRFGEEVTAVAARDGVFETRTAGGVHRSRALVLATGYNRVPVAPRWPGQDEFRGPVIHSSSYKNGAAFRGKRVLVVGIGNTGGEIAIDLTEHGADASISIRSPVVVVPRDFLGAPTQVTAILMNPLPLRVRDWIGRAVSRMAFGDLSRFGLGVPRFGPATLVARGRIPLIDVGTVDLIRRGVVAVLPEIDRFRPDGVAFKDGRERPFDSIVLATGYKAGIAAFFDGAADFLDETGYPHGLAAGPRGLYFLGFVNPPTGFLRQIALDAPRIAAMIAADYSPAP
jgi:cation diffusion facilitator CzcD-associated flavoprotein CzcO